MRKLVFQPGERGYKKQARADRERDGVVYFIEAMGMDLVKIGYTTRFDQRLANILSFSPVAIRVLGELQGGPQREQEIHNLFDATRNHGEWFRKSDALLTFIAENCRPSPFAIVAELAGRRRPPDPMTRAAVRAKREAEPLLREPTDGHG